MLAGVGETSGWEPVAMPSQHPTRDSRSSRPAQVRIAVLSTPRAGNTWLRHLLVDALQARSLDVHEPGEVPWGELPSRWVFHLHWYPDDRLVSLLEHHGFLICTVARHPCDVLVSILRYAQAAEETYRWLRGEGGDERGLLGATPASPLFEDYASSARARALLGVTPAWEEIPSTRLIRYEDLLDDTIDTLSEAFADVPFDRSRLAGSVERTSLQRMRRMHRDRAFHFWQGQAGTWESLVPTDMAEIIATTHPRAMDVGDYSVRRPERLDAQTAERNWYALEAESLRDEARFLREQIARVGGRLEELEDELSESRPIIATQEVRFVVEENLGMRSLRVARVLKRVRDILRANG